MRRPLERVHPFTYRYSHRDTVSSVGLIRKKTLPGTADGMKHVCLFRHALALDERRVKFLPEYVSEGIFKYEPTGVRALAYWSRHFLLGTKFDVTKGSSQATPTPLGTSPDHV